MNPTQTEDCHQSSEQNPVLNDLSILQSSDAETNINHFQRFNELPKREFAIKVENVWKKYEKHQYVLMNFNMAVPKGSIYSLLGSSGCGKTTILNCLVGRQTWDSGTISILESIPSTKRFSNTDCRKLGYMPQELALQGRLTIKELLLMYGRLHGMKRDEILARLKFLQGFLQLPEEEILVSKLSGGQQRRASLAVALLHQPELIILDEPTVGLDPLLRQSIWEYLQNLVLNFQVTIVLTTHYVDEARRSNYIGLMREGRIIAEDSPQHLIRKYESPSLDQIVLRICKQDAASKPSPSKLFSFSDYRTKEKPTHPSSSQKQHKLFFAKGKLAKIQGEQQVMDEENGNVTFIKIKNSEDISESTYSKSRSRHLAKSFSAKELLQSHQSNEDTMATRRRHRAYSCSTLSRLGGLLWATYLVIFRHPAFVPFTFLQPVVTTALVQFVFGSDLHDLKFGYVINDEPFGYFGFENETQKQKEANCLESKFSYLFLDKISSESLAMIPFSNKSEALASVHKGNIWGFVNIPTNYTFNMQQRMLTRQFSDPETIEGSIIGIHLDMSSLMGSILVIQKLSDAYKAYLEDLATSCGLPSAEFEIPLKYNKPVFGDLDGTYAEHVVPGLIVLLIFVLPLGATCVFVIEERKAGCMDRMRVSGMASWDLIVSHYVTHASFQAIQVILSTLVLVFGFSYVIKGSILLYVIVNACYCACGLAIGFFLGIVCASELQALFIVFAITSFLLTFSGVFWPIDGLQLYWKAIAYCLPTPLVSRSFRSVFFRGVSITHDLVWPGLVVPLVWMSIFLIMALIVLRRY